MADMFGVILPYLKAPLFWVCISFLFLMITFGMLWVRRNKRLSYPCVVIRQTGNGKIDMKIMRCGWFKTNRILGGLIDYGSENEMIAGGKRNPMTKIQGASLEDFHDINGQKGMICKRKEDDPKMLVPLNTIAVVNNELITCIAPADYRDASVDILKQAERETRNRIEQMVQHALTALVIIMVLIAIMFTINYVSKSQSQSWEYVKEAQQLITGGKVPSSGAK